MAISESEHKDVQYLPRKSSTSELNWTEDKKRKGWGEREGERSLREGGGDTERGASGAGGRGVKFGLV